MADRAAARVKFKALAMVVPAGARSIDLMKNIWIWILGGVALIGVLYLYMKRGTARNTPSQANPGTAGNPAAWFGGWMGYTQNALAGGTATAQGAFSALNSLSNAFGLNDGGNSDVSIGGSSAGGVQSSGSGAGVATDDSGYDDSDYDFC